MKKLVTITALTAMTLMSSFTTSAQEDVNPDISPMYFMQEVEPNDDMSQAVRISSDGRFGQMSTASDIDWYYISPTSYNTVTFKLSGIESGDDYDLKVYDENGNLVGSSTNGGNADETVTVTGAADKKYYAKVYSYSGSSFSYYYYLIQAIYN
jgi:outer membrane protein assembly factor BamE (lipoprotein component of BamABCDE complex)